MSVTVRIPTPLRRMTNGEGKVEATPSSMIALIEELDVAYPGIKARLVSDEGELHYYVNLGIFPRPQSEDNATRMPETRLKMVSWRVDKKSRPAQGNHAKAAQAFTTLLVVSVQGFPACHSKKIVAKKRLGQANCHQNARGGAQDWF